MKTATKTLSVYKTAATKTSEDVLVKQLGILCHKALGKTLQAKGWGAKKPAVAVVDEDGVWKFSVDLVFTRKGVRNFTKETFESQFEQARTRFLDRGKRLGWFAMGDPEAGPQQVAEPAGAATIRIPEDWQRYFDGIYDRDDQIREVMESIRTAKETNMEVRNHLLLFGPPGCGKTKMGLAVADLLGHVAVKRLDATATTKAGAENLLLEMEDIPPILIIEELEKCNEANLPWLLGILDDRGEIIKTNARVGSVSRLAPCLVIATVNNISLFERFQEGALADRFSVPLYFAMPDRALLRKILLQEVAKIPGGREEWVDPALDYALNVEKTYKARRIRAIMTNARDRLIDGTYQASRIRMMERRAFDRDRLAEYGIEGTA